MSKSSALRFLGRALPATGVSALVLCFGLTNPAAAVTMCPNQAVVGGINQASTDVSGPLDGVCGTDSAVKIDLALSKDYGKLTFSPGYPPTIPPV